MRGSLLTWKMEMCGPHNRALIATATKQGTEAKRKRRESSGVGYYLVFFFKASFSTNALVAVIVSVADTALASVPGLIAIYG